MGLPWFRLYHEFADDPKVQMLPEAMQRRLVMLFCERCKEAKLDDIQRAFHWRISMEELDATKTVFLAAGFIDEKWNVCNWMKRQFLSDSSTDRVRRHRMNKALKQDETLQNVTVTVPDTDTDTDTEQKQKKKPSRKQVASGDGMKHSADPRHVGCKEAIFEYYRAKNKADPDWNGREGKALGMLLGANPQVGPEEIRQMLRHRFKSEVNHAERPGIFIPNLTSFRNGPLDRFGKPLNGGSNGKPSRAQSELQAAIRELEGDHGDASGHRTDAGGNHGQGLAAPLRFATR
jgi:hypothetical protein